MLTCCSVSRNLKTGLQTSSCQRLFGWEDSSTHKAFLLLLCRQVYEFFRRVIIYYYHTHTLKALFAITAIVALHFFDCFEFLQAMARKNEWPLDKMCLQCDVTKKHKEDFSSSPREGAYIHSLYMEGARWDPQTSLIAESILKDLTPTMPVIFIKVK